VERVAAWNRVHHMPVITGMYLVEPVSLQSSRPSLKLVLEKRRTEMAQGT